MLSGFSEVGDVSGSTTALLLAMAVRRGMEVPALLLEPKEKEYYPATFATSYGTSKAEFRKGSLGQSNVDDCFYWFGQDGLFSSLNCYVRVGDAYKLWNRHPMWDGQMKKVMRDAPQSYTGWGWWLVTGLGVDFDLGVPPYCPTDQPILPNFHLPK